jgi:hypothetical protein
MEPGWLSWAQRLQAIAQTGLAYAVNQYDVERYVAVREIAAEMMAEGSHGDLATIRGLFASQTGYATPKVDVRGVVFRENRILLVKEREDAVPSEVLPESALRGRIHWYGSRRSGAATSPSPFAMPTKSSIAKMFGSVYTDI